MAINYRHDVSPVLAGEAAYAAQAAIAGAELGRFDLQFRENQRQFNERIDLQAELAALEQYNRERALGQQAYQFDAGLGYRAYSDGLQYDLSQQQIAQRDAEAQMNNARMMYGQFASVAQQRQQQRFEQAVSDQKALMEQRTKGFIDNEQYQQAVQQWEQRYEMPFGFPDQLASEQAQIEGQQQMEQVARTFFTDPISGELMIDPSTIAQMQSMGMTGKDIASQGLKMQTERRNWEKLKLDSTADTRKQTAAIANQQRDDERAMQEIARKQQEHEQRMAQDRELAQQKIRLQAQQAYMRAYQQWATPKVSADGETVSQVGPEPKLEDFLPEGMTQAGSGDDDEAPDWYKALPKGATYQHPDDPPGSPMRVKQ